MNLLQIINKNAKRKKKPYKKKMWTKCKKNIKKIYLDFQVKDFKLKLMRAMMTKNELNSMETIELPEFLEIKIGKKKWVEWNALDRLPKSNTHSPTIQTNPFNKIVDSWILIQTKAKEKKNNENLFPFKF